MTAGLSAAALDRITTMNPRIVALAAAGVLLGWPVASPVRAGEEWPQFRGPQGDGVARGSRPPLQWGEGESKGVRWHAPVHGRGWGSPVVGGGRVWLTTATEKGT